jgi:predicted nucleotidyltransferase
MACGNARGYLFKDSVRLKKYFYVLRPLLAIRYIQAGLGVPPVEFEKLVEAVSPLKLRPAIATLLELKRRTPELGLGDPIAEIGDFITSELAQHGKEFSGQGRPDILSKQEIVKELNELFRATVMQLQTGSPLVK